MPAIKTLVIAAAGTGGHVFPALVVAKKASARGMAVIWVGTNTGLESRVVREAGFELMPIASAGVLGKSWLKKLSGLSKMFVSTFKVRGILKKRQVDAVICFGGYVSMPVGLAAVLRRVPLYLHEQNAIPGLSNRLLTRFAVKIFLGFPGAVQSGKAVFVGNPVRDEILHLKKMPYLKGQKIKCLIVGGSRGAQFFNTVLPGVLAKLPVDARPELWHQTGESSHEWVKACYKKLGIPARISAFIEDMAEAYVWADVIICRAGAMTVAEVIAVGLPAIFIPFPYATHNHQAANAQYLVSRKAAICFDQRVFDEKQFLLKFKDLVERGLINMSSQFAVLQSGNAGDKMLDKL